MFGIIEAILIALISLFVPGILLSFALLRKTELHTFEIIAIGIIFGLIAPATMTWLEAYLMNYIHFFSYSLALFEINALILAIIGAALCYMQGAFSDFSLFANKILSSISSPISSISKDMEPARSKLSQHPRGADIINRHKEEERSLIAKQEEEMHSASHLKTEEREDILASHRNAISSLLKSHKKEEQTLLEEIEGRKYTEKRTNYLVWSVLLILMLVTFYTRIMSMPTAPNFFEFDPYFDMIDAHYILTYGHQLLLDPSAWPVIAAGTNHRIEPIVPYLEAYWYSLANVLKFHYSMFNTSLMGYIGGIYPPITAALLVFVIFMLLYHEYDAKIGLIGAGFTAMMPTLISTFIAGEQLVEPWGIMTLFFFFAAYMLAIRNMKDKRLAVLAGLAFVSTFLGAHYYTVTTGVMAVYIVVQGIIEVLRGEDLMDFYKMNVIMIVIIGIFLAVFLPYKSTLQARIPNLLGMPMTISAPIAALIFVAIIDYLPKIAKSQRIISKNTLLERAAIIAVIIIIGLIFVIFTPLGTPLRKYINLSARFTTPSIPLFMTVQEFIPTGLSYNFGANGFGTIGASIAGQPVLVWIVCALGLAMVLSAIIYRKSRTGILYISIVGPLMFAGFSEVKYLPHFGVAYIMLIGIIIGELAYLIEAEFSISKLKSSKVLSPSVYTNHRLAMALLISAAMFFMFGILSPLALIAYIVYGYIKRGKYDNGYTILIAFAIFMIIIAFIWHTFIFGENLSIIDAFKAAALYSSSPSSACTTMSNNNNGIGVNLFCNTIPQYWLNAMSWINANVGPTEARVLAWWDYGDWINWFGNSNAVLRGDNAVATEDYAVAAQYVLGNSSKYNATPSSLLKYMNANQSKYVLFDQDLISKWGALDFLACINVNGTSLQYAVQQGSAQSPKVPYALGTSQCELSHDPQYALVPLAALVPTNSSNQQLSDYCSISNAKTTYISTYLVTGQSLSNSTVCVDAQPNKNGVLSIYNSSGTKLNAVLQTSEYLGVQDIGTTPYVEFMMIYLPNANGVVANAPTLYYTSNYYRAFFLGNMPGFKQVYPNNASVGTNFVNFTDPIRIYEVINYTGTYPQVPKEPSWITTNDIMP